MILLLAWSLLFDIFFFSSHDIPLTLDVKHAQNCDMFVLGVLFVGCGFLFVQFLLLWGFLVLINNHKSKAMEQYNNSPEWLSYCQSYYIYNPYQLVMDKQKTKKQAEEFFISKGV